MSAEESSLTPRDANRASFKELRQRPAAVPDSSSAQQNSMYTGPAGGAAVGDVTVVVSPSTVDLRSPAGLSAPPSVHAANNNAINNSKLSVQTSGAASNANQTKSPAEDLSPPATPVAPPRRTSSSERNKPKGRFSKSGSSNGSRKRAGGKEQMTEIELADAEDGVDNFEYAHQGLTTAEAEELVAIWGPNALPDEKISLWYVFAEQFWQPMPIMIWIATIVEAIIGNYIDMGILLFIQFANASIGFYEITKATDAVAKLKESLQSMATVNRDGKFVVMPALNLVPGDLVILAAGSSVPADCRVNPQGKPHQNLIDIDESAINGESLPKGKKECEDCLMGTMVVRGECEATVDKTGANTELGTTAALLKNQDEFSNMHKLLASIVSVLTVLSIILCAIVLIYLTVGANESFKESLSFAVVVLVSSIPMAVEIVTNTTLALGSGELNKEGAIVSRLSAIEDLASMSILCSDKTGTLTTNHMEIREEICAYTDGVTRHQLLRYCAMAAKWKEPPKDALDKMCLEAVDMDSMNTCEQFGYIPFDPVNKRTEGTVTDSTLPELGQFKTSKGAPKPILALCKGVSDDFKRKFKADNENWGRHGIRSIAIARTNANGDWEMMGMLSFMDPPRPDAKETLAKAKQYGVAIKMITGDNYLIAKEMTNLLELGQIVRAADGLPVLDAKKEKPPHLARDYGDMCLGTDAFAQVFPEHKYLIVECLRELGYKVGMTGDGVNDAPALKRADVGVAVKGATEAAQSAAAIVLTQPGLSTIISGIIQARCIFVRIRNFLHYRIAATLQLLVFFFIAVFWFKPYSYYTNYVPAWLKVIEEPWPAFFHMPVLMLMLITLLNDGTMIAVGYDNVVPQEMPEKWNRMALFFVSSVLATVALISSLLLLWFMLDSWRPGSVFQGIGLGGLNYGQVTTAIYLKISVSDFLTLFSSRTGGDWFWTARPANVLIGAGSIALAVSTALGTWWPDSKPDGIPSLGMGLADPKALSFWIWVYCIFWWFVQDAAKVFFHSLMVKHNWFGYNETGKMVYPPSTLQWREDHMHDEEPRAH